GARKGIVLGTGEESTGTLLALCGHSVGDLLEQFPGNALAVAVPVEAEDAVLLVAVEPADRLDQPPLGIHVGPRRGRVVDPYRPALLGEGREHQLLTPGGVLALVHEDV